MVIEIPEIQSPLIFDTSALFNFGHRGEMESVLAYFAKSVRLVVPPAVLEEASQQLENREYYRQFVSRQFTITEGHVSTEHEELIKHLVGQLGSGELAVVILTLDAHGTAVIDDPEARVAARQLGIHLTGTLGLMATAIKHRWISEVDALNALKRMRSRGFRIPAIMEAQSFAEYAQIVGKKNA